MKKSGIFLIFFLFVFSILHAQKRDSTDWKLPPNKIEGIGMVVGVHQFANTYFELGVSATQQSGPGCLWSSYYHAVSLSATYNPFQKTGGIEATVWGSFLFIFTVGASVNSYTDFDRYNLGLKPFIGIGPGNFSLTYGYNFQLINNHVKAINRNCISLRYSFMIRGKNKYRGKTQPYQP